MSVTNEKYRLNDVSQLEKYQEDIARYNKFVNRVYAFLDSIEPGEEILVSSITDENTIDIFIKVVCLYITYCNPSTFRESYIIFSDDYTVIKRVPGFVIPERYVNNFYENK